MTDLNDEYALVFNGEMFNYLELKELKDNYPFKTGTDTEAGIAAYEKWGKDCFLDLMVSVYLFIDKKKKQVDFI